MILNDANIGDFDAKSETTIEGVDINLFGQTKLLNIEFYASPTRGTRREYSGTEVISNTTLENKLSTISLHFLASIKLNKFVRIGLNRTKAKSDFELKHEFRSNGYFYENISNNSISIDTSGYGIQLNLYKELFFLGAGLEEITYKNIYNTRHRAIYDDHDDGSGSFNGEDEFEIKKKYLGLAFISGNMKKHGMKIEIAREWMPPLFENLENIKDGEANIYSAEMNTKFFIAGASYKRIRGYFINTYKLAPFFLNINKVGNSFKDEIEFSFSLKLSKGGNFGASILFSEENTEEQVDSFYDNVYPVSKKTSFYSLSYSYLF